MKRIAMILACVDLVWAAACSSERDRQPRAVKDDQSIGLVAVSMSDVYLDSGLVGSAASADEPARPAAETAPAVAVDVSSQDAAARSYVSLINAGQLQQISQVLVGEQQQAATEIASVLAPLAEAAAHLHSALNGRFSGHAFVLSLQNEAIPADWFKRWTVVSVEVDATDADTATAHLKLENGEETAVRTLKKSADAWHVQEAGLPSPDTVKAEEALIAHLAESMRALAGRVESGEIADAAAAEQEIAAALAGPGEPATESADNAAAAPNDAQPAPAAAKPAPKAEPGKSMLETQMDQAAGRAMFGAP